MFEQTIKFESVEVTVGATERGLSTYVQLTFPNLIPPHNEGPTIIVDDPTELVDALTAVPMLVAAHNIGADHGASAASWIEFSTPEAARAVLAWIDEGDGDPDQVSLPSPDLSGQWADGFTVDALVAELDAPTDDADLASMLADAYESAFIGAVEVSAARAARAYLDD